MLHLQHLQQQFWSQLRSRNTVEEPVADDVAGVSSFGNIDSSKRLNIYHKTMRTGHINALAQCYGCCEKILGSKYFNQIAKEYYYQYPSTDQNLNHYGKYFPEFLTSYIDAHAELNDYQYLADLSQLEKSYHLAYFSKDDGVFDFQLLSSIDSDSYQNICFTPGSAVSVQDSEYPIFEVWHANQGDNLRQEINPIGKPQYLCVYRKGIHPVIDKITFHEWWTLKYILLDFSLLEMESMAANKNIDIPFDSIVPQLIQKELICSFVLKNSINEL